MDRRSRQSAWLGRDDRSLIEVASVIQESQVARYSGEEFLVLLPP